MQLQFISVPRMGIYTSLSVLPLRLRLSLLQVTKSVLSTKREHISESTQRGLGEKATHMQKENHKSRHKASQGTKGKHS